GAHNTAACALAWALPRRSPPWPASWLVCFSGSSSTASNTSTKGMNTTNPDTASNRSDRSPNERKDLALNSLFQRPCDSAPKGFWRVSTQHARVRALPGQEVQSFTWINGTQHGHAILRTHHALHHRMIGHCQKQIEI